MTTMLKAAKLVDPHEKWRLGPDGRPYVHYKLVWEGQEIHTHKILDLKGDAAHQMALQIALEKLGWKFGYLDEQFRASFDDGKSWANVAMDTKPELLIECVEAMEAL